MLSCLRDENLHTHKIVKIVVGDHSKSMDFDKKTCCRTSKQKPELEVPSLPKMFIWVCQHFESQKKGGQNVTYWFVFLFVYKTLK